MCKNMGIYGNEVQEIKHESGMTLIYDPSKITGFKGLHNYGQRLAHLQFKDLEGFKNRIDNLAVWGEADNLPRRQLEKLDFAAMTREEILKAFDDLKLADSKEIFDVNTGEHLNSPSGKYNLVQNKDLFNAVYNVTEEQDLKPMGRIDEGEGGFTTGYIVLAKEGMTINLLEQYNEPVMLMPEIRNSAAGQMGVTFSVAGIEGICSNIQLWGKMYHKETVKHSSQDAAKMSQSIDLHLKTIVQDTPKLVKLCSDAEGIPVKTDDLKLLLWGVKGTKGLPIRIINAVADNPGRFNVRLTDSSPVGKLELSQFQAYNCVTNALTFKHKGGVMTTINEFEAATKLLTEKQDKLLQVGEERLQAYVEALQAQKEGKAANKQLTPMVTVEDA